MAEHLRCIYDSSRCNNEPIYYILMGCLNQHLGEGSICFEHSKMWINLFDQHDLACKDCGEDIAAYLIFHIHMVNWSKVLI